MSIQSRDCDYCVRATVWRAADPVPLKCHHCGAPPKIQKAESLFAHPGMWQQQRCSQMEALQNAYPYGQQGLGDMSNASLLGNALGAYGFMRQ
jgi:hypothetical protein